MTMPRVTRAWLLVGFLILIAATGCGHRQTPVEQGARDQILHFGNGAEPSDLDPHIVTGVPEHSIMSSLLEGLVSPDPRDLHPMPGAAESWEISPDGKVYTFHLRKNGKWSNGEPLTAQDFVDSYQRILTPALASEYGYMLFSITNAEAYATGKIKNFVEVGVKALEKFTLQITLHDPTPYFLSMLGCHYSTWPVNVRTIARHGPILERGNKWTRPGNYVGNGPFVLDSWKVNQLVKVRKNTNYWDAEHVKLNAIYFYPTEEMNSEERMFRTGLLHKTETIPPTKIAVYKEKWPQALQLDPYFCTYFYRFNCTKKPFSDVRVRKALGLAFDRKVIVQLLTRKGEVPATTLVPPLIPGYEAPQGAMGFDVKLNVTDWLFERSMPTLFGLPKTFCFGAETTTSAMTAPSPPPVVRLRNSSFVFVLVATNVKDWARHSMFP